jgi:uncharacterized protein YdiU (UPF0061 family)
LAPALAFDNSFVRELSALADPDQSPGTRQVKDALFSFCKPTPVPKPTLLAHSREVAGMVGLSAQAMSDPSVVDCLAGNASFDGATAYANCYGGHQFGSWAGQLGDGRAIHLGEIVHEGRRLELQLKGAGPTPYSRGSDGRAVLRSSIREFLCRWATRFTHSLRRTRTAKRCTCSSQVVERVSSTNNH